MVIKSSEESNCTDDILEFESDWLQSLSLAQLVKVIVFSIWELKLHYRDAERRHTISTIRHTRATNDLASKQKSKQQRLRPDKLTKNDIEESSLKKFRTQSPTSINLLSVNDRFRRQNSNESDATHKTANSWDLSPYDANRILQRRKALKR